MHDGSNVDWWGKDNRKWNYLVEQLVRTDAELCNSDDKIAHYDNPVDKAAVEWMLSTKEGLELSRNDPEATIKVRYESLVSSPDRVIPRLLKFCDLSYDPVVVKYAAANLREKPLGPTMQLHPLISDYFGRVMSDSGYTSD
jgi:hypothetical protein